MSNETKKLTPLYCPVCRAPLGEFADGFQAKLTCHKCSNKLTLTFHPGAIDLDRMVMGKHPQKALA